MNPKNNFLIINSLKKFNFKIIITLTNYINSLTNKRWRQLKKNKIKEYTNKFNVKKFIIKIYNLI